MLPKNIKSNDLGINLESGDETEYFKWFLACVLSSNPIQQSIVKKTYDELISANLTSPDQIINAGLDRLVLILDTGQYMRFGLVTAAKLLDVCTELKDKYGTVMELIKQSKDYDGLMQNLIEFKGLGSKTAKIFVKEIPPKSFN